jgi:CRISPR type I-E-associated protein CasB/Cse2
MLLTTTARAGREPTVVISPACAVSVRSKAALTIDAFRSLYRLARPFGEDAIEWDERLVVAAVTLAHVRADAPGRLAAQLLSGAEPDHKLMSEARFLRLMRARTPAELLDEGRRIAALLKSGAPVGDLGASLLLWLDDPHRRRIWAQAYYRLGTPPAANQATPQKQSETGVISQ